jgi:nucleoid-associated protein YgaU
LLVVVVVVAAGFCAAWPFRRRDRAAQVPPSSRQLIDVALRQPDVALEVSSVSEHSPASNLSDRHEPGELAGQVARQALRPDLESLAPPPRLAQDFGPLAADLAAGRRQWQPVRMKLPLSQAAMRRHRLTDGDSLEGLAERYLGDARRANEIFEVNREILPAADLLPLGKIIRIPASDAIDELSEAR